MMDRFKEILKEKAKEGKFLSEDEKAAKMDILKELKEMAHGSMSDDLKKITIASDSEEGLKAGLEKAEEVLEKKSELAEKEQEMNDEEGYDQELVEPEMSKEDRIAMLREELAALESEE